MTQNTSILKNVLGGVFLVLSCCVMSATFADPPLRADRISIVSGKVLLLPAGKKAWIQAKLNQPITLQEQLSTGMNGRLELQLDRGELRMAKNTQVTLSQLDNQHVQFQLKKGSLHLHIWRIDAIQTYQVDTPWLSLMIKDPGDYRIDVFSENKTTAVRVRQGMVEVAGLNDSHQMSRGEYVQFSGKALAYQVLNMPNPDAFDEWCAARDKTISGGSSHVGLDVIGFSDLEQYGAWELHPVYGKIWLPFDVATNWVPYRYGVWLWIHPWGWTWVDDAPWGFAPFHYGRWIYLKKKWAWVPGPVQEAPVYAPALVGFLNGADFFFSITEKGPIEGMGWFPLGPGDVYVPAQKVSREYFTLINRSNTIIEKDLHNIYQQPKIAWHYRYQHEVHAVTAVLSTAFAQGQPIAGSQVKVTQSMLKKGSVTHQIPAPDSPI